MWQSAPFIAAPFIAAHVADLAVVLTRWFD